MPLPLPIDEWVPRIVDTLRTRRALVLSAEPGAGKTTRVPPALCPDGPVFLLQPRRVAARSIARRIAEEQEWVVGREVGWQVRFEREYSDDTRLLVATEGILTGRLHKDPLLSGFRTVVLDEFHERTVHADLALAFLREAMEARGDLRVLVMSATLESGPIAAFLGGVPILDVPGRAHAVDVSYAPGLEAAEGVRRALRAGTGHMLCFLPGAGEIRATAAQLGALGDGVEVRPLHGTLDARAQDAALAPWAGRKVVLATNVAETSLTVDGVSDVVDTGLHKVLRYDPARGIDRLELERIGADSAVQRSGRAGRTGPGRALRLWDPRDRLRPSREPEILRVDLAAPILDVLAWGGDLARFRWFEAPEPGRVESAVLLLERLGGVRDGRLTRRGDALRRLPLHPRLGAVLLEAGGSPRAAAACAVLVERRGGPPVEPATTDSDVLSLADRLAEAPFAVRQAARELERLGRLHGDGPGEPASPGRHAVSVARDIHEPEVARHTRTSRGRRRPHHGAHGARGDHGGRDAREAREAREPHELPDAREARETGETHETSSPRGTRDARCGRGTRGRHSRRAGFGRETRDTHDDDLAVRRALLAGFPDRVARRREPRSDRLVLASGAGAVLSRQSGVREGELLLALEVVAGTGGRQGDALVTVASRIAREWLEPTRREVVHRFDEQAGAVRASERLYYLELLLEDRAVAPSPDAAAPLLVEALAARGLAPVDASLVRRAAFAGVPLDVDELRRQACAGRARLPSGTLGALVPAGARRVIDAAAPSALSLPSGRRAVLDYREDGTVVAAVKLQELFGLAETPRIGPRGVPVVLELLAPSGRPVQTTRDLRSFWTRTYPQVRRELRGRYPRHPWPENPWTAEPTHRSTRRR